MDERKRREVIRQAYDYRCGYCHVHEDEIGSKLEIDHYRPPLVALRRTRQEVTGLQRELVAARLEQTQLRERIASLERELEETVEQLTRLLGF
ncbi:MAG: hypothetical protein HYR94_01550 [Chloroflexi bacterium]|nr:hypothetical protein [Chloroflexota bacterium]